MAFTLLSTLVVLGLVLESRRRLWAVRALRSVAQPFLSPGAEGRASSVRERRAYVAALNEATLDIGAGLDGAGVVPRHCARAALALGALAALLESAQLLRGDGSRQWLSPAIALVGGCAGALGCALLGRAAEVEARRLRADWAALIRRSSRDVPT